MPSDAEDIKKFSIKLNQLENFYKKLLDINNPFSVKEYYNEHLSAFLIDITTDRKNIKKFGDLSIDFLSKKLNRLAISFSNLDNQENISEKNIIEEEIRTIFKQINQKLRECLQYYKENNPNIPVIEYESSIDEIPHTHEDQVTHLIGGPLDKKTIHLNSKEQIICPSLFHIQMGRQHQYHR